MRILIHKNENDMGEGKIWFIHVITMKFILWLSKCQFKHQPEFEISISFNKIHLLWTKLLIDIYGI